MKSDVNLKKHTRTLQEGWANINALRACNIPLEENTEYKFSTKVIRLMEIILETKANETTLEEMLEKYDAILM